MKSFLYIAVLYLGLSLLAIGCSENAPEPNCFQAEVVGQDCDREWYILRLLEEEEAARRASTYMGQLQGGLVTTDNLPEAYRQPGRRVQAALELNGENSPRCLTVHTMYPAVRVKRICNSPG